MKILVSGSTGLIGTAAVAALRGQGHQVLRLLRPATEPRLRNSPQLPGQPDLLWDPAAGVLNAEAEESFGVVHLAGASIGAGRWTAARKRTLEQSRIAATRHLVGALAKLRRPPQVFVAASAVGFYGSRGDELLTEESSPGDDFLARLCIAWEAESARAAAFGARVVILRFGIVLAKHGGALRQMSLPFRFGLGGPVGSGRQWMSWITLDDLVRVIGYALETNPLRGPVNTIAPQPVRNAEFAAALGRALHRPSFLPVPAFALRLALGEMADGLLLSSQRAVPRKIEQCGYRFLYPDLAPALQSVLAGPH